tara:strand:- start:855 stop:3143 length:2289 start_codon:yes stop_codon:yes gene_type:complete
MKTPLLQPDLDQAKKFLSVLDSKYEFTFQTIDSNPDRNLKRLVRTLHGSFETHSSSLTKLNLEGASIFVTVNQTDLLGRSKANITRVRAVFVDLDGAPLSPVLNHICEPHIIVESSPDRWHAYWLCNLPLDHFSGVQSSIASLFDGDPAIKDLPRVMRLPGFIHQKVKDGVKTKPFVTQIEQIFKDYAPYDAEEIEIHFPPLKVSNQPKEVGAKTFTLQPEDKEIREVLQYIDPQDREQWITVGYGLKSLDENLLSIFLEFSRGELTGTQPNNFAGDKDVIKTWNGLKPNRIGFGALINMAKTSGYKSGQTKVNLKTGSQVEIARLLKPILMEKKYTTVIYDQGCFWGFQETHWKEIISEEIRITIHQFDGIKYGKNSKLKLSKIFIDGIINELAVICSKLGFFSEVPAGVNLLNGFVQIHSDGNITTVEHSADHRQRFLLKHVFEPNLSSEWHGLLSSLFNGCFKEQQYELSRLVLEIFGCAICGIGTKISAPLAFIFYGQSAANGKSQMQQVLRELLPKNMTCSIPPADLDKEQYLAKLVGKQANLSDEISGVYAISSDKFKAVVTGDPVTAKVIYQQPIEFKPTALHLLSTNILPNFKGGVDAGIERRLAVVPFERSIPVNERISEIAKRVVSEEGSTLVSEAIRAAANVFKKGSYSLPQSSIDVTERWLIEADPIKEWLEAGGLDRHKSIHGALIRDLYLEFRAEMQEEGVFHIPQKRRFNGQLRAFVGSNPCWHERRSSKGSRIYASDLVTQMKNFS